MFYTIFNNTNSEEIGIKAVDRYNLPVPLKKYKEYPVEGINGILYEDTNTIEDLAITVPFNFIYKDNLNFIKKNIKKWLFKVNDNKLIFSDNSDYYYRVKKVECTDIERSLKIGVFEVTFIVEGFEYLLDGSKEKLISNGEIIENNGEISKPIIRIVGEGNFTISFNNKSFSINVGQEIIVDTEEELLFKNGEVTNTSIMKGDFPLLYEGENIISWTGNIREFYITTNLREL